MKFCGCWFISFWNLSLHLRGCGILVESLGCKDGAHFRRNVWILLGYMGHAGAAGPGLGTVGGAGCMGFLAAAFTCKQQQGG